MKRYLVLLSFGDFNPRGCVSLDIQAYYFNHLSISFQSTRLRKPRLIWIKLILLIIYFNPRGCVSLDFVRPVKYRLPCYFNPRGCVSLDAASSAVLYAIPLFQSTRLRKPRHILGMLFPLFWLFQSTRLRKPRQLWWPHGTNLIVFQSTRLRKPRRY